jgi:hypothetical protein
MMTDYAAEARFDRYMHDGIDIHDRENDIDSHNGVNAKGDGTTA